MILLKKASQQAIRYSCLRFHYAKAIPVNPVGYSVFENNIWCGTVLFGRGANNNLAKSFGFHQGEVIELTRMALNGKQSKTSQILSIALKLIKKDIPLAKLCASYADFTNQKHVGVIYQATNWLYMGERISKGAAYYIVKGKKMHGRSVRAKWGSEKNIPYRWSYADEQMKHLYVYLFDKSIKIESIDYPKSVSSSTVERIGSTSQTAVQL